MPYRHDGRLQTAKDSKYHICQNNDTFHSLIIRPPTKALEKPIVVGQQTKSNNIGNPVVISVLVTGTTYFDDAQKRNGTSLSRVAVLQVAEMTPSQTLKLLLHRLEGQVNTSFFRFAPHRYTLMTWHIPNWHQPLALVTTKSTE